MRVRPLLGGGGGRDTLLEGGGRGSVTYCWSPALEKRAARRRVRLSEKARGAEARPALQKRAARRRVRLSKKARGAAARPAL